jgi:hypothetical protein
MRAPDGLVYARSVIVVVYCRLIIVSDAHTGADAFFVALTSKVPSSLPPFDSWQPLNTTVTPFLTDVTDEPLHAGGAVFGVTVTWLGQTDSPRINARNVEPNDGGAELLITVAGPTSPSPGDE